MASDMHDSTNAIRTEDEYTTTSGRSKFRFKTKRKLSLEDNDLDADHLHKKHCSEHHRRNHHHHHHHNNHRRIRSRDQRPNSTPDDPTLYDDTYLPNSRSSAYLDPDTAFRESLFDALADDEGAAFWEGVYGQPIHTYSSIKTGPEGELERMTDEEYTAYVRARMYEKTHQHIIEERNRREQERKRKEKSRGETERLEKERRGFEAKVAESLRMGEERRVRKRWSARWENYLRDWQRWNDESRPLQYQGHVSSSSSSIIKDQQQQQQRKMHSIRDQIPWPVESGRFSDINKDTVETFFRNAPPDLLAALKVERVRWHPDKIQQKLGGRKDTKEQTVVSDEQTMKAVTAIFQILDKMWAEERVKKR